MIIESTAIGVVLSPLSEHEGTPIQPSRAAGAGTEIRTGWLEAARRLRDRASDRYWG